MWIAAGYLTDPWDFFTNPRAKTDFKKMLRYVIARYGYSDNIFAWELWNEVSHLTDYMEKHEESTEWHIEMANFIKGIDAYNHMVTSSIGPPSGDDPLHSIKELDFANVHLYGGYNYSTVLLDNYIVPIWQNNNKPILMSEVAPRRQMVRDLCGRPQLSLHYQILVGRMLCRLRRRMRLGWEWIDKYNCYYLYRQPSIIQKSSQNYATMPSLKPKRQNSIAAYS